MTPRVMALFTERILCPNAVYIDYSILSLDGQFKVGIAILALQVRKLKIREVK